MPLLGNLKSSNVNASNNKGLASFNPNPMWGDHNPWRVVFVPKYTFTTTISEKIKTNKQTNNKPVFNKSFSLYTIIISLTSL